MTPAGAGIASERGAALIEAVIAVTVLTIILIGLLPASVNARRMGLTARGHATGTAAAQTTMDSLRSLGWSALTGQSGSYVSGGRTVNWQVSGSNPRRILVVVGAMRGRTRADTFVTFVAR